MGAAGCFALPSPEATMRLIARVAGRKVTVASAPRLHAGDCAGAASYVDAGGSLCFVVLADRAFLAAAGSSLAIVPSDAAETAIESGDLAEYMVEGSFEILNVASVLMTAPDGAGIVKLSGLSLAPDLPGRVIEAIEGAPASLDLEVEIAGYPKGRLSLLTAETTRR